MITKSIRYAEKENPMKFATNYSYPLADLLREGAIQLDRIKCPAWPDLIQTAQEVGPVYVHFPLVVGRPDGVVWDDEAQAPADWDKIEHLLNLTDTPYVNVHMDVSADEYPTIPRDTHDPAHQEILIANFVKGIETAMRYFGKEKIIAENTHSSFGRVLRPAYLPDTVTQVIETADCGFLLDVSHARLAAMHLGRDPIEYLDQLPTHRIREIHITGIQRIEGDWLHMIDYAKTTLGLDEAFIQKYVGQTVDHVPMTDDDWAFWAWMQTQFATGTWATPWAIAFEYGGVKGLWEMFTDRNTLAAQVPRFYHALNGNT